jgi:hypothetical protein
MKNIIIVLLALMVGIGTAGFAFADEVPATNVDPVLLQNVPTDVDDETVASRLIHDRVLPEEAKMNLNPEPRALDAPSTSKSSRIEKPVRPTKPAPW